MERTQGSNESMAAVLELSHETKANATALECLDNITSEKNAPPTRYHYHFCKPNST